MRCYFLDCYYASIVEGGGGVGGHIKNEWTENSADAPHLSLVLAIFRAATIESSSPELTVSFHSLFIPTFTVWSLPDDRAHAVKVRLLCIVLLRRACLGALCLPRPSER